MHRFRRSVATIPGSTQISVVNPATGKEISSVTSSSSDVVNRTIKQAHDVFKSGVWSKAPPLSRSRALTILARRLEESIPELAELETMQTGRTIREMNAQLKRLPEWLDYFAALLRTHQAFVAPTRDKLLNYVQRVPLGVVAQITPFNHPLLIALKKIAPALAAGNSVIVKPSELAPLSVIKFGEMADAAGIPLGVLSILPGYGHQTGLDIVQNPLIRKVDVTAGTSTGRILGRIVGENLAKFTAELGGKAPLIIFDDADLINAVNGVAFASFVASGQTCVSGTRILIHDTIYDSFVTLFLEKTGRVRRGMGNSTNPRSTMGTVISPSHLDRIHAMVKRAAATSVILAGGSRMLGKSDLDDFDFSNGCFYPPTVIADVDVDSEIWQEEVFGPVVVLKCFSDESEAVRLANASKYGLGAGIWTSDLSRAHRVAAEIESGLCWINTHHKNDPSSPWGGMKESGIGRENGIEAFEHYTQSKSTIVNIASAEESRETDDWFADGDQVRQYG